MKRLIYMTALCMLTASVFYPAHTSGSAAAQQKEFRFPFKVLEIPKNLTELQTLRIGAYNDLVQAMEKTFTRINVGREPLTNIYFQLEKFEELGMKIHEGKEKLKFLEDVIDIYQEIARLTRELHNAGTRAEQELKTADAFNKLAKIRLMEYKSLLKPS